MTQQGCDDIVSVSVKIVRFAPSTANHVGFVATYAYRGRSRTDCPAAPVWSATRSGLTINQADPFRASIPRQPGVRTTITATAPNGVAGTLTIS
jgi:hypothetical protein